MDGNRDEGDRCFQIALGLLRKGLKKDALKFFMKSERLYPSKRTKEHIEKLVAEGDKADEGGEEQQTDQSNGAPGAHGTEGRSRSKRHSESEDKKKYTTEEENGVNRIRRCKDYYEILGLKQDCSEDELKRAYKKLALRYHPDKNHAPGATEAFKAISNAFSVLNDPSKRKRYDQFGAEEEENHQHHHHHRERHHDFTRGFEGDMSAEDLFNMFFNGGLSSNTTRIFRTHTTRTHGHHHINQNDSRSTLFVQLGPIIFLLCISLFSALFSTDPLFSLSRSSKYIEMRQTRNLRVNYWVKGDFKTTYKGDLQSVENQVEEEYVSNLRSNCYRERLNRENLMWQARQFQDQRMWEQARGYRMASCEKLQAMAL